MSRKATYYSFLAATTAAAASALLYFVSREKLKIFEGAMEGNPDDGRRAANAETLWLLILTVTVCIAALLLVRYLTSKPGNAEAESER